MNEKFVRFFMGYIVSVVATLGFVALGWVYVYSNNSKVLAMSMAALICWLLVAGIGYFLEVLRIFTLSPGKGLISLVLCYVILVELIAPGVIFTTYAHTKVLVAPTHVGKIVMGIVYCLAYFIICMDYRGK